MDKLPTTNSLDAGLQHQPAARASIGKKVMVIILNILIWPVLTVGVFWMVNGGTFDPMRRGTISLFYTVVILLVLAIVESAIVQHHRRTRGSVTDNSGHTSSSLLEVLYAFILTFASLFAVLVPLFGGNHNPDAGYAGVIYIPVTWAVLWAMFFAIRKNTHRNRSLLYFVVILGLMVTSILYQRITKGSI